VALAPDVIVGQSTPVIRALREATSSIPIVMAAINDPVDQGFVSSLARPGGNITGFTFVDFQLVGKWLEILKEAAPGVVRAALMFNPDTSPPSAITEAEAQSIAVDAYVYFYSLVTMDVTRRQFTNIEPGKEPGKGPMNMFNNVPEYPPASFKGVVRPNFDTLYSIAYLDMTKEPVIVSVPDTNGRYYLLPMLDMWSDVFASPGWRTTGTQAGNFFITPPGWSGTVPDGMTRISAPTPYVWIIGRTKTDGPPDYAAVNKIQAGFKVTLLSECGKTPKPVEIKIDPSVDMKTPPKVQVDTMPAGKYFAFISCSCGLSAESLLQGPDSRLQNTVCFDWPCSARPATTAASSMSYSMQIFGGDSSV
jgi:Protein of unknown function (DUF1254)/ABC transporter substrate binding protein